MRATMTDATETPAMLDETHGLRRTRAAAVSIAVAAALAGLKFAAGLMTNSLSLLASAVDSLTDIFASTVNFFAIRAAARPADADHAYGHGKAEGLAGLFQSVVISASGLYLGYEAVRRLVEPQPLQAEAVGIAVMAISMVATQLLVWFLRRVARETRSLALEADSLHFSTDVLANAGVLVLLVIVKLTGVPVLDPLASLAISAYILYAASGVMRDSIDQLMDRALPDDIHVRVREIALSDAEVAGVHDIKSRASGPRRFIEIHLEIDGSKSLQQAHDTAVRVLRHIEREIPGSKVFVHTDPV
jgi:ferrous-iron efflux pump FieF